MEATKNIFESRVDTLQLKEPIENRTSTPTDCKGIEHSGNGKGTLYTKMNPNNYNFIYSADYQFSKTKKTFDTMRSSLPIIDLNQQSLKRLDIATDSDIKFDKNLRLIGLVHKCISATIKNGYSWTNTLGHTLIPSSFIFRSPSNIEIEFYNKALESRGKAPYNTRFEIRFLRTRTQNINFEKYIKDTIKLWEAMPLNLEKVENEMITLLKEKWKEELVTNINPSFSAFVHKYEDHIYTRRILNEVYKEVGFKSNLASWLSDYRKKYTLNFCTKKDLTNISNAVVKSLKIYIKK